MIISATQQKNSGTKFRLIAKGITDIGLCRESNEDFFHVDEDLGLLGVFDGMGGAQAGEVASELAAIHLRENCELFGLFDETLDSQAALELVEKAVAETNRSIFEAADQHDFLQGMGTTATAFLTFDGWGLIAHVGDSRLYRIRDSHVELLTQDHTLANELINEGHQIQSDEAFRQFKRMLTKVLGPQLNVKPDLSRVELKPHDRFVLCSDGLSNYLTRDDLALFVDSSPPATLARRLVKYAKKCGGADNITVIVADVIRGN